MKVLRMINNLIKERGEWYCYNCKTKVKAGTSASIGWSHAVEFQMDTSIKIERAALCPHCLTNPLDAGNVDSMVPFLFTLQFYEEMAKGDNVCEI